MQQRTLNALVQSYLALLEIANNLYDAGEYAVEIDNYNEASLLQTQADRIFELAEDLEALLSEQAG